MAYRNVFSDDRILDSYFSVPSPQEEVALLRAEITALRALFPHDFAYWNGMGQEGSDHCLYCNTRKNALTEKQPCAEALEAAKRRATR